MKRKNLYVSLIVLITVLLLYSVKYLYAFLIFGRSTYDALPLYDKLFWVQGTGLLLCLSVPIILRKYTSKTWPESLGFNRTVMKPFFGSVIAVMPMLIGFYVINGINVSLSFREIFWMSIWAGINEEIVYRAFIVGILVRYANWPFLLAAILSGILFGMGHLYQAATLTQGIGIFLFTTAVGVGFAAFFKYWNWNIWFPLFLHIFMNLSWVIFSSNGNVLMNSTLNIFRGMTILLAVVLTIVYIKSKRNNTAGITKPDN